MKRLWKVTLSPLGQVSPIDIRADRCEMSDREELTFYDFYSDGRDVYKLEEMKAMFAPGQWVMVESISEDGESENAANYAYKELEKDD